MLNVTSHYEITNQKPQKKKKTTVRCHVTPIRMAIMREKMENYKYW